MLKRLKSSELNGLLKNKMLKLFLPYLLKFLPFLLAEIDRIQLPVEKGGFKEKEDDGIVVLLVKDGPKILINVHPTRWYENIQRMALEKPVKSHNITELLDAGFGVKMTPEPEAATLIKEDLKNEEE